MRKFLLSFIFILSVTAQSQTFNWAEQVSSTSYDVLFSAYNDNAGNIYTAGYISGPSDLDPGPGMQFAGSSVADIFIQKLNPSGNLIWAKSIGGMSNQYAYGLCIDAGGNVLVTGGFKGNVDFDPNAGVATLSASTGGGMDIFILKLDANGNFVWAKNIGSSNGANQNGYAITTDINNNVLVTGAFDGTMDFDPGAGVTNLTSAGQVDIFVMKLNSSGIFQWAKRMGSFYDDYGYSIKTDASGNVITTGRFLMQTDFDPGAGTYPLGGMTTTTDINMFVQKLDAAGNFVWARDYNFISNTGRGLFVDNVGDIYVTGNTSGGADFDNGPGTAYVTVAGANDIFVLKLNSAGNYVWVNSYGGSGHDFGYSIDANASGEIFVTGAFQNTADFMPGAGTYTLVSNGMQDIFTMKLNSTGNLIWAVSSGGTQDDYGYCVKTDNTGNVYYGGYFQSTVDINPLAGVTTYTSGGVFDAFLVKLQGGSVLVSELVNDNPFVVYPNPTTGTLQIQSKEEIINVEVYNVIGQLVFGSSINTNTAQLDLQNLSAGIYNLRIITSEGSIIKKIIKE